MSRARGDSNGEKLPEMTWGRNLKVNPSTGVVTLPRFQEGYTLSVMSFTESSCPCPLPMALAKDSLNTQMYQCMKKVPKSSEFFCWVPVLLMVLRILAKLTLLQKHFSLLSSPSPSVQSACGIHNTIHANVLTGFVQIWQDPDGSSF